MRFVLIIFWFVSSSPHFSRVRYPAQDRNLFSILSNQKLSIHLHTSIACLRSELTIVLEILLWTILYTAPYSTSVRLCKYQQWRWRAHLTNQFCRHNQFCHNNQLASNCPNLIIALHLAPLRDTLLWLMSNQGRDTLPRTDWPKDEGKVVLVLATSGE